VENNLTIYEKNEFENLEGIIGREMKSFMAVGNALLTIRDNNLYREEFKTFEEYCRGRWGMGKTHANCLIGASAVAENLTAAAVKPTCEYQIRPLTVLDPDQQCDVWAEAVRAADGKVVTYKQVKGLVDKLVGPKFLKPPKEPEEYTDAVYFATIALSQLSRIRDKDPRRDEAINMVSDWVEKEKNREKERKMTKSLETNN